MNHKIVNWCQDIPDSRDLHYMEVFWVWELPPFIWFNFSPIYNQWNKNDPDTAYWCTCYASAHCVNEENCYEHDKCKLVSPSKMWKLALTRWANIKKWWSLQWAANLAKDLWFISGYTLCRSLGEVKQALASNQTIQSWSNKINWKKTLENGNVAVEGDSYWHSFAIVGYDDSTKMLRCRNSYGDKTFDAGHFFIKYEDFRLLFSCYAYADISNSIMIHLREELLGQRAFCLWIWNNERWSDQTTRLEAITMIWVAAKLENTNWLWNWNRPQMPVTIYELSVMLTNAFGKIPFVLTGNSRLKIAGYCARLAK